MSRLLKFVFSRYTWVFIFGLALGIAIAMAFVGGLAFDRSDSARFFGSFLGSLITIAGAVSLYYLKEIEQKKERIDDLIDILEGVKVFCSNCITDLEGDDLNERQAGAEATDRLWKRAMRFAEEHEFSAHAIGHALQLMQITDEGIDQLKPEGGFDFEKPELLLKVQAIRIATAEKALVELRSKKPRKSE